MFKIYLDLFIYPRLFRHVIFQAFSVIFTTLDIFKLIWPHSGIFWMIQAFRILAQLHVFMYIEAYSELMAYEDIFRTVDIFNQFQTLLKSYSCIF